MRQLEILIIVVSQHESIVRVNKNDIQRELRLFPRVRVIICMFFTSFCADKFFHAENRGYVSSFLFYIEFICIL